MADDNAQAPIATDTQTESGETSANTSLMFGGRYNSFSGTNYNRGSSLMNYSTNTESNTNDWTVLARFTQRFGGGNDSVKSLILKYPPG